MKGWTAPPPTAMPTTSRTATPRASAICQRAWPSRAGINPCRAGWSKIADRLAMLRGGWMPRPTATRLSRRRHQAAGKGKPPRPQDHSHHRPRPTRGSWLTPSSMVFRRSPSRMWRRRGVAHHQQFCTKSPRGGRSSDSVSRGKVDHSAGAGQSHIDWPIRRPQACSRCTPSRIAAEAKRS